MQAEVARSVAEYDAATCGPTKWPRLTACLQQQYGQMVADFVQRCEAEAERKVSKLAPRQVSTCAGSERDQTNVCIPSSRTAM